MLKVGNAVGNDYWERGLPRDFVRPIGDRVKMEAFLRDKYVNKRWAPKDEDPPHLRQSIPNREEITKRYIEENRANSQFFNNDELDDFLNDKPVLDNRAFSFSDSDDLNEFLS